MSKKNCTLSNTNLYLCIFFLLVILLNDAYIFKFYQILQTPKSEQNSTGNLQVNDIQQGTTKNNASAEFVSNRLLIS